MDATARRTEREPSDLRALAAARLRQGDVAGAGAALRQELARLKVVAEQAHREAERRLMNARITSARDPQYSEWIAVRTKALDDQILLCSEIAALERAAKGEGSAMLAARATCQHPRSRPSGTIGVYVCEACNAVWSPRAD